MTCSGSRRSADRVPDDENTAQKLAIFGALALYLDFINLVISLLRIFGGARG